MLRLAIMGSGFGTNLTPLVQSIRGKNLPAQIEIVVSDKPTAGILEKAKNFGLPAMAFPILSRALREQQEDKVSELFSGLNIDLIVLTGYMSILSARFTQRWNNKIINVHPSLLPDFAGLMNYDVHKAVLAAGVKETGCTVHYVAEKVDAGPILLQKTCPVLPADTVDTLKTRVQGLEGDALIEAIILHGRMACHPELVAGSGLAVIPH